MQDPDIILDALMKQTERTLKDMNKTKDADQRKVQSEIVKNLCDSAGVFFSFISDMAMSSALDPDAMDMFGDDEDGNPELEIF